MNNWKYLSEADLCILPEYRAIAEDLENNQQKLHEILWKHGMDVFKGVEVENNTHRTLNNKTHTGKRFVCIGRSDDAWLRGGYATTEDYIYSKPDLSFQKEMRQISRQGVNWDDYVERVKKAEGKE